MQFDQTIPLNVEFKEKEKVRNLGAYFDPGTKVWCVPPNTNLIPFRPWLPAEFCKAIDKGGAVYGISLSHFYYIVKKSISHTISEPVWVQSELVRLQQKGNFWLLNFVETSESGKQVAQIDGLCSKQAANKINRKFIEATGAGLKEGFSYLMLVRPDVKPAYGKLQISVEDVDPRFTLGDAEANLLKIRETLKKEGLYTKNAGLPRPFTYCRVAVVAPKEAAGLGDFYKEIDPLRKLGVCEFVEYPAVFEGPNAEDSLSKILNAIYKREETLDAILILRGGGAKTSLAWLNSDKVARFICQANVPVLTAIGHEQDITILDEVSNQSFGTPSKLAYHVVDRVVNTALEAYEFVLEIQSSYETIIERMDKDINLKFESINDNVQGSIQVAQNLIDAIHFEHIPNNCRTALENIEERLKNMVSHVINMGPQAILERGFTFTRGTNGEVVSTKKEAQKESILQIHYTDGKLIARPQETEND